jgi:hypothetical protein
MPSLEDELNALLAGSASLGEGIADAKKVAKQTRRRSKDLEEEIGDLAKMGEQTAMSFGSLKSLASGMGYEDVFEKIDLDKNGTLEPNEILAALNDAAGPDVEPKSLLDVKKMVCEVKGAAFSGKSDAEVNKMTDEELKIGLSEFKLLMKAVDYTEEGMEDVPSNSGSRDRSRRASKEILKAGGGSRRTSKEIEATA